MPDGDLGLEEMGGNYRLEGCLYVGLNECCWVLDWKDIDTLGLSPLRLDGFLMMTMEMIMIN